MDVLGVNLMFTSGVLGRIEGKLFEQPLEDCVQPARTDIFRRW